MERPLHTSTTINNPKLNTKLTDTLIHLNVVEDLDLAEGSHLAVEVLPLVLSEEEVHHTAADSEGGEGEGHLSQLPLEKPLSNFDIVALVVVCG
jgi:hypothetical protein